MSIYEEKLRQWPVPSETFFVATRYGKTHVIASGDPASPPVVLLHPEATSALAWAPLFRAVPDLRTGHDRRRGSQRARRLRRLSEGEFQETWPLIVAPICTNIPFKVGTDLGGDAVARTIHDMRMAIAINALGLPAVAVPVGVADGLPQVVQIIGPRYREDLVLDAAAALENALGAITPIDPR